MQGEVYKCINTGKYYLINSIGTYNYLVIEFETFSSRFINIENFNSLYLEIKLNSNNLKKLLDNYKLFQNTIDYNHMNDFKQIKYNNRIFSIKNWYEVFNFGGENFN